MAAAGQPDADLDDAIAKNERTAVVEEESSRNDVENLDAVADAVQPNEYAGEHNDPATGAQVETELIDDRRTVEAANEGEHAPKIDETAAMSGGDVPPNADEFGVTRDLNTGSTGEELDSVIYGEGEGTNKIEAAEDNHPQYTPAGLEVPPFYASGNEGHDGSSRAGSGAGAGEETNLPDGAPDGTADGQPDGDYPPHGRSSVAEKALDGDIEPTNDSGNGIEEGQTASGDHLPFPQATAEDEAVTAAAMNRNESEEMNPIESNTHDPVPAQADAATDGPEKHTASDPSELSGHDDASHEKRQKRRGRRADVSKEKKVGPVRRRWRAFKETRFYRIWDKRIKFSYAFYAIAAFVVIECMNMMQLWSVDNNAQYDASLGKNLMRQVFNSERLDIASNKAWMNFIALTLIFLVILFIINRFWVATAIFGTIMIIFAVANKIKIGVRGEVILPSDLNFLSAGNGGELVSFVPESQKILVSRAILLVVVFIIICIALQFIDKRRTFIWCSWKHPIRNVKNIVGTFFRIIAVIVSVAMLMTYAAGLGTPNSAVYKFVQNEFGYTPRLWDTQLDASSSGSLTTFLSLTKVNAMDEPDGYSESAMKEILSKYEDSANTMNESRGTELTDSTVIAVLSESFSDPNRVPGISFSEDPMPYIHQLETETTSGLMLSSGYGGGTANIEFQELTGLSMANFDASLLTPYQQLIPNLDSIYTFNQMWNDACGSDSCSVAYHPYYGSFYNRISNYKKFGFSAFHSLDSDEPVTHQDKIDRSTTVSDEAAYEDVLDEVKGTDENQFVQLITMQNHTPYVNQYDNNQFIDADQSTDLTDDERTQIDTYTKGVNYTDEATEEFLDELNRLDKPVTVIFYGDHLPGIYSTAYADSNNEVALHETDYFIWSNDATLKQTTLNNQTGVYSSSNYFMAQAAEHLNAKVSPYLAMLTQLHEAIPAMARIAATNGDWAPGNAITILDAQGNAISESSLSDEAKALLKDYQMVQYDMTVGKNYLEDTDFTSLPRS
ncbi:sulfatase-like hydrolase/transferase [Bifidobacterium choloepi]|uniref:sulfatase-like hydrolase/transferase n=1 Tax=Bifidobacterium choloepi TaxID=2614131 RepID=UPI0013D39E2D